MRLTCFSKLRLFPIHQLIKIPNALDTHLFPSQANGAAVQDTNPRLIVSTGSSMRCLLTVKPPSR